MYLYIEWNYNYLNESSNSIMEQMSEFHDHAMMIMNMIFIFITLLIFKIFYNKILMMHFFENEMLEILWTLMPALILLTLAFPSLQILYLIEESIMPIITIKIIGNQWYWTYEYEGLNLSFDSFMKKKIFRLLDVDKSLILPYNIQIRLLVTSMDVIHSWSLPSTGTKMDANPGRLNLFNLFSFRSGWYYGQCSEICGINHAFMPIKVEFISLKSFKNWLIKNLYNINKFV